LRGEYGGRAGDWKEGQVLQSLRPQMSVDEVSKHVELPPKARVLVEGVKEFDKTMVVKVGPLVFQNSVLIKIEEEAGR